jgi:hypothetical protein
MPSLKELIQRVHDQLDYNPDLQQYKDSVVRRINHHYLEICDNDHWLFLQKTENISLKKKVEGSSSATISISSTEPRLVTGSGTSFSSAMQGQTFVGPDGLEITVGAVASTTELYLTDKYAGGVVSGSSDWSVRFDRYTMPADCIEPLGFVDRADDRGRLRFIDRRREELEFLDKDDTGEPFVIIEDDHVVLRPPFEPPVLASGSNPAITGLPNEVEYEYFYTFMYEGRQSPPSPVASIKIAPPHNFVEVDNIENTQYLHASGSRESKKLKRLYRRLKDTSGNYGATGSDGEGRFYKVADLEAADSTYTDVEKIPTYAEDLDHLTYFIEHGPRQTVRFWYTSDQDRAIQMRYHYRPPRLQADADHPVWPVQYHHLLVYRALQDIMLQHGAAAQAQLFQGRAEDLLKKMRNRYLSRTDRKFVRRAFDNRRAAYRFSPPVKT